MTDKQETQSEMIQSLNEKIDQEGGGATKQYVSFTVGDEQYGVDILAVREFKGWTDITTLPNQAEYVRGVLNLRGDVVPILDMRCKFQMGQTDATAMHVVIIVSVDGKLTGLLVDSVSDILSVNDEDIKDVPDTGSVAGTEYLAGIMTINETMIALLDLPVLVGNDQITGELPQELAASA